MDELRAAYDLVCDGLSVEELSGRNLQKKLLKATRPGEIEDLFEYLWKRNFVPVRAIITEIKQATPELARESLKLCIEQSRKYQQNRHDEPPQDTVSLKPPELGLAPWFQVPTFA